MSKKQVSVVMVGIGGYGATHVNEMLNSIQEQDAVIVGVVDVKPENSKYYQELKEAGIPMYASLESFYAESSKGADLAVISTPIQYHCPQTCLALASGSHVLVEKPVSATVQEAIVMMEAQKQSGDKFVAVGYNWSFNSQIQQLKQDIISGIFGQPKRLKSVVLWRRNQDYFSRGWKGQRKSPSGEWILDSVAHNATSHFLHNMFYLLGATTEESAFPRRVQSELYRANPIENFDTCVTRAEVEGGIEVLFAASHAITENKGPNFCFEFEKATLTFNTGENEDEITALFHDGSKRIYPRKGYAGERSKLLTCIQAIQSGSTEILCGLEAAYAQVLCMNGMLESVPVISDFPQGLVHLDEGSKAVWVDGLKETLLQCYDEWKLPSELGVSWATAGRTVDLTDYRHFKG
jgi:predicted dehydrogenase